MSFEDLIKLKEAQEVIERLASSVGVKIEELNDKAYGEAHKSLGKVIDRWESKPWFIEKIIQLRSEENEHWRNTSKCRDYKHIGMR